MLATAMTKAGFPTTTNRKAGILRAYYNEIKAVGDMMSSLLAFLRSETPTLGLAESMEPNPLPATPTNTNAVTKVVVQIEGPNCEELVVAGDYFDPLYRVSFGTGRQRHLPLWRHR
jgi:hypothetical protein